MTKPSSLPVTIEISADMEWWDWPYVAEGNPAFKEEHGPWVEWKKTSVAWANRNKEKTIWLSPICTYCYNPAYMDEHTICLGDNPHDDCPDCDIGPIPFREVK